MPSYASQLGVFERFMKVAGNSDYPVGAHFQFIDASTLSQFTLYESFLDSKNIHLEKVAEWFFGEYLSASYAAGGFAYTPSSANTYLEKTSHVFQQIDGIIKQFNLFATEGYIDQQLLAKSSYVPGLHEVSSVIERKYVHINNSGDIQLIMYHLFSDQSSIAYIDEKKKGNNFVELLEENNVVYSDFSDRSKLVIDELIRLDIVSKKTKLLTFVSKDQVSVLKKLFAYEAVSYHRSTRDRQDAIDRMVKKDWLAFRGNLLTQPEASYLNFMLNKEEFGNGPELRNKYIHPSMTKNDRVNEELHKESYIKALRILMCLILKIDDDLYLGRKSMADESI